MNNDDDEAERVDKAGYTRQLYLYVWGAHETQAGRFQKSVLLTSRAKKGVPRRVHSLAVNLAVGPHTPAFSFSFTSHPLQHNLLPGYHHRHHHFDFNFNFKAK